MSTSPIAQGSSATDGLEVVIVGAGFGGVAAAIELKRHGIDAIRILERAPDLGGIWFYNTTSCFRCAEPGRAARSSATAGPA